MNSLEVTIVAFLTILAVCVLVMTAAMLRFFYSKTLLNRLEAEEMMQELPSSTVEQVRKEMK